MAGYGGGGYARGGGGEDGDVDALGESVDQLLPLDLGRKHHPQQNATMSSLGVCVFLAAACCMFAQRMHRCTHTTPKTHTKKQLLGTI